MASISGLLARLEKLENTAAAANEVLTVVFVDYPPADPGEVYAYEWATYGQEPQRFMRGPGESARDLLDRAKASVKDKAGPVIALHELRTTDYGQATQ